MRLRTGLIALCAAAFAALSPAAAQAATGTYAPQKDAQTFATSDGGWTSSHEYQGILCGVGVICPVVTNSWVPSGGADGDGDGFIRSEYATLLGALGGTTIGIWQSPEFTYNGAKGARPSKVTFAAAQRSDLTELLGLLASSATYSVAIVEAGEGGARLPVVTDAEVPEKQGWTPLKRVDVPANALKIGGRYFIEIRSKVATSIAALALAGYIDHDNVRLIAKGASKRALKQDVKAGFGKLAATNGPKAAVAVRCPAAVAPKKCRMAIAVKLGRKIATKRKAIKLRAGKARAVTLKVKPRFRKKILKRKRVVVQAKVRAAGDRFTVRKRVKLRKG